ncbi:Autophagy protein [Penicillium diatomitis]|uniref:Autophagy protein 5 n=1 Tax=Penicillium diatomitis TaxID=2819901 RepID=A0A9W9X1I1_9EURO|nr:Autophagy protein [Penicillium diatomitis]KAJ5480658.1 Autophagy protein [Penicillium diatomitis]
MDNPASPARVQQCIWEGRIPLEIALAPSESRSYDKTDTYMASPDHAHTFTQGTGGLVDALNRSRVQGSHTFHRCSQGDWPSEDLVRLDENGMVMNDAFINSVKEADFLRNGTAKGIMTLSKEDSSGLWKAVEEVDLSSFQRISQILLPPPSQPFRNVPIRIFLPLPPDEEAGLLKVVQSPLPPFVSNSTGAQSASPRSSPGTQPQTIGGALHALLPNLFPSRRTPVLAKPVLHGAVLPMSAPIEEVVRCSAYGDGWAYIVVRMMG